MVERGVERFDSLADRHGAGPAVSDDAGDWTFAQLRQRQDAFEALPCRLVVPALPGLIALGQQDPSIVRMIRQLTFIISKNFRVAFLPPPLIFQGGTEHHKNCPFAARRNWNGPLAGPPCLSGSLTSLKGMVR